MNISLAIVGAFPTAVPAVDFRVLVDQDGNQTLEHWNEEKLGPSPTQAQLDAGWTTWQAQEYREKRAREYPSIGDQLDALWKGGVDADAMKARVLAVKAKYPKP